MMTKVIFNNIFYSPGAHLSRIDKLHQQWRADSGIHDVPVIFKEGPVVKEVDWFEEGLKAMQKFGYRDIPR